MIYGCFGRKEFRLTLSKASPPWIPEILDPQTAHVHYNGEGLDCLLMQVNDIFNLTLNVGNEISLRKRCPHVEDNNHQIKVVAIGHHPQYLLVQTVLTSLVRQN